MVGHQRSGINAVLCYGRKLIQMLDEVLAVSYIIDNPALIDSIDHYMVQSSLSIQSGLPRH
jgi:hypothetical protein